MDVTQQWNQYFEHAIALGMNEEEAEEYADMRMYRMHQRTREEDVLDEWYEDTDSHDLSADPNIY